MKTIAEARLALDKKEMSAVELVKHCLDKIKERDAEIHAFLSVFEKEALELAQDSDAVIKAGRAAPLTGIPVAVKDNILIKDFKTTAGSKILENYTASYDATAISRLKKEGAVFIGKTNLDEFAMGSSTENSAFGPTKNPLDLNRSPGGSSGGSVAAVAAGMCLGALGSETGGSVRQPASFCGVVGFKPTYGSISRHGLIALASSFDQIGPVAQSVGDARLIFNAIAGPDELDSTTLGHAPEISKIESVKGLKIGVPKEYFETQGLDPLIFTKVKEAISWFEKNGADIKEISLPTTPYSLPTYYILVPAESSANLARYDGVRYGLRAESGDLWDLYRESRGLGLGDEPIRRIMIGTYALSAGYHDAYYKKALWAQGLIKQDFKKAFESVDVIVTPTSPTVAFKLGEKAKDPLAMYAADIFTAPANIAGIPAISLPCGMVENLPVGLQIMAAWQQEQFLFNVGELFEKEHARP